MPTDDRRPLSDVTRLNDTTLALVDEFILRARKHKLDHIDCIGRAAQIISAMEPGMTSSAVWGAAEEMFGDRAIEPIGESPAHAA